MDTYDPIQQFRDLDAEQRRLVQQWRDDVIETRRRRERRKERNVVLIWLAICAGLAALALAQLF